MENPQELTYRSLKLPSLIHTDSEHYYIDKIESIFFYHTYSVYFLIHSQLVRVVNGSVMHI